MDEPLDDAFHMADGDIRSQSWMNPMRPSFGWQVHPLPLPNHPLGYRIRVVWEGERAGRVFDFG